MSSVMGVGVMGVGVMGHYSLLIFLSGPDT